LSIICFLGVATIAGGVMLIIAGLVYIVAKLKGGEGSIGGSGVGAGVV